MGPWAGTASVNRLSLCCHGLSLCSAFTDAPFHRHDVALLAGLVGLLTGALAYLYNQV